VDEVLLGAIRISTPYILAAMGGLLCERSGVINIALEGVLLMSALAFAVITHATGDPWIGLLCAMGMGALVMSVHAGLCINARANHIIVGLGINLVAAGGVRFVLKVLYNSSSNGPRFPAFESTFWHHIQELPVLGGMMPTPITPLAVLVVVVVNVLLFRTVPGLRIRAVGEHPLAAQSQGVAVRRTRWMAVLLGGVVTSLGGVYLAADQHQFTHGMSAGRGYIALAAVVFGQWIPARALLGCVVFGLSEAVQIHLQSSGTGIPTQFVQMIPYILTLAVLAFSIGRARMPAALGRPFPETDGH